MFNLDKQHVIPSVIKIVLHVICLVSRWYPYMPRLFLFHYRFFLHFSHCPLGARHAKFPVTCTVDKADISSLFTASDGSRFGQRGELTTWEMSKLSMREKKEKKSISCKNTQISPEEFLFSPSVSKLGLKIWEKPK